MADTNLLESGLKVNDVEINLPLFSIFAVPGEVVRITAKNQAASPVLKLNRRIIVQTKPGQWEFSAPRENGVYELIYVDLENDSEIILNLFVTVPLTATKDEHLERYLIGTYPVPRTIKNVPYRNPKGLISVTKENEDMRLTPHLRLGQFLCKQQSGYPKFVVIQEKLLLLLEKILAEANQRGFEAATFGFISGYRTPFYNKKIKNVTYSRHIYGDAADIFIDADNDGRMDDLNSDGRIDIDDARVLYDIAVSVTAADRENRFKGGIGIYKPSARHAGFVHVDTRGYRVRW